jgi:hypothetical protein
LNVELQDVSGRKVLRFATSSEDALLSLKSVFQNLASGKPRSVDLLSLNWIHPSANLRSLRVQLVDDVPEPSRTLEVTWDRTGRAEFNWSRSSDGWLESAELIAGLPGPGHQYLNNGHYDDVEIEVSFKESARSDSI